MTRTPNSVPKKFSTIRPRRCSVCKKNNHTKIDCPLAEARALRESHIPVHFSRQRVQSPHVISLSDKKITASRKHSSLPIFSENIAPAPVREVVDFAEMIRQANSKTANSKTENNKKKFTTLSARFAPRHFLFTALSLALIAIIPFPAFSYYQKLRTDTNYVVQESVNAFLSLQSSTVAMMAANVPQAELDLNSALNSFSKTTVILEKEHKALVYIASSLPVVGKKIASREHILKAGHMVALGNAYMVKGMSTVSALSPETDFLQRLAILKVHIRGAIPQYRAALLELAQVKSVTLPVEYQNSFTEFKILFSGLVGDLEKMTSVMGGFETVLGSDSPRRYLVVFQNHHELRPTGGFIGSLAIIDVQRGKVTNIEIPPGGSYDFQGQLDAYVKPPLPLQIANARWEFQDANWFPDFPATAEKIAWFYNHSRGASVDGVIAINASVLERVLTVLGPIANDQYQLQLSASNALEKLQTEVETGVDKANHRPKAVIGAVFNQLMENSQTIQPRQLVGLFGELGTALKQKEIQIYTTDSVAEKKFSELGWTGEIARTLPTQDYLFVVNTNLGGAKSDARMTDAIDHQAVVQADGSVLDTVIIRRKHSGVPGDELYGKPNSSYLRVYVPDGAELVSAGGFIYPHEEFFKVPEKWYDNDADLLTREIEHGFHLESGTRITSEFGKTVFGNWITTNPGEETEVWFTYKLPFKISPPTSRFTFLVQKQSGTNSDFSTQIIYPDGWSPVWRNREDAELGVNGVRWTNTLATDELFGVLMRYDKPV